MTIELIVGENRILVLDLIEAVGGGPLSLTGWELQLRFGIRAPQVVKSLVIDALVPGRASCTLIPGDLAVLASGPAVFAIWRTGPGEALLIAEGAAVVRRVLNV